MSDTNNEAGFAQANHTLTLVGQKNPTKEHLKKLHDGYLSDLVDAIIGGTVPDRETFRASIGLPSVLLESVPDTIIRVNRSAPLSYPSWVTEVMHPELEKVGPTEYDITKVEQWLHDGQRDGKCIEGSKIYTHLKDTDDLKNHFGLCDLKEIQKKGVVFFRKHFAGKVVPGWSSVVRNDLGGLCVPVLYENGGEVVLRWRWFDFGWDSNIPALRHAKK